MAPLDAPVTPAQVQIKYVVAMRWSNCLQMHATSIVPHASQVPAVASGCLFPCSGRPSTIVRSGALQLGMRHVVQGACMGRSEVEQFTTSTMKEQREKSEIIGYMHHSPLKGSNPTIKQCPSSTTTKPVMNLSYIRDQPINRSICTLYMHACIHTNNNAHSRCLFLWYATF